MAIQSGTHLGPYEILSAIGAGGMGEVYRARDTKLGRDVALKVLPEAFARDVERMARFQREAKVLPSLNHPNIASIYGLEDSASTHALVMELVEGPTLADRIKSGPIPIDESLRIAKQMCDALEYAHERGIVHRDLKPANIKVITDDTVKILDFGLAKALEGDTASIDISTSPTISRMATQGGVLLGTAAYMSPEQAKGKSVDRPADIWAFGCVLYEMLTGKMAFRGESATDTLGAIIHVEPDWSQLPATTPVRVRVLLQRCSQKNARQRLRDIGDARISLDEVLSGAPEAAPGPVAAITVWQRAIPWAIAGLLLLRTAALAFLYSHQKPSAPETVRYQIPFPEGVTPTGGELSPDGSKMATGGLGADGEGRLWVQSLEEALDAHALDGTEGANGSVIWSPDGRFIAFLAQGKLKKIAAGGGPVVMLCDAPAADGGDWSRDGQILLGTPRGIMQVAASGGPPSPVTTGGRVAFPSFLPDGRHFLYTAITPEGLGTYIGTLGAKPEAQAPKKLLGDSFGASFVTSSDPALGYVVFSRGALGQAAATLMAQPFDPGRLEPVGQAIPIAEQVAYFLPASATDVLEYIAGLYSGLQATLSGKIQGQLGWFDREGKVLGTFEAEDLKLDGPNTRPVSHGRICPWSVRLGEGEHAASNHRCHSNPVRAGAPLCGFSGASNRQSRQI
jgi:eukaryotic-like serine/threonine-protein kinase